MGNPLIENVIINLYTSKLLNSQSWLLSLKQRISAARLFKRNLILALKKTKTRIQSKCDRYLLWKHNETLLGDNYVLITTERLVFVLEQTGDKRRVNLNKHSTCFKIVAVKDWPFVAFIKV